MKEIDFLPQWYKTSRRRRISNRTQYVGIFGILAVMMLWSALTGHSVRSARAQLSRMKVAQVASSAPLLEYNKLKNRLQQLSGQAQILEAVNPRIIVSSLLAELAFLIDQRIVLSELNIKAEAFEPATISSPAATIVQGTAGKKRPPLEGNVKFGISITGLAVNASDVARLIRTLEGLSDYVREVKPIFCRDKKVKNYQAAEFRISCYIANYLEEN